MFSWELFTSKLKFSFGKHLETTSLSTTKKRKVYSNGCVLATDFFLNSILTKPKGFITTEIICHIYCNTTKESNSFFPKNHKAQHRLIHKWLKVVAIHLTKPISVQESFCIFHSAEYFAHH